MTIGTQWRPKLFAECLDLTQQTLLPPSNLRLVQFQTISFWMKSGAEELKPTFCTVPIQNMKIVAPLKELVLFANLLVNYRELIMISSNCVLFLISARSLASLDDDENKDDEEAAKKMALEDDQYNDVMSHD